MCFTYPIGLKKRNFFWEFISLFENFFIFCNSPFKSICAKNSSFFSQGIYGESHSIQESKLADLLEDNSPAKFLNFFIR